jgi:hypothetical protein
LERKIKMEKLPVAAEVVNVENWKRLKSNG